MSGVLSAAALVAIVAGSGGQTPEFPAQVATVRLDVWVGREGQLVSGLTAGDFEVKDDGVVQDVELVTGSERALETVLVLDTSSSVAGQRLQSLKSWPTSPGAACWGRRKVTSRPPSSASSPRRRIDMCCGTHRVG